MKRFVIAFSSFIVLSACNSAPAPTDDAMMDDDSSVASSAMMEQSSSSSGSTMSADSGSGTMQVGEPRVIEMTVTDWSFSPSIITASVGEKVVVRLVGGTGMHSFGSTELGINVAVGPGETVDVEIPTDKAGTFSFRCMVPCGEGHKDMTGTIVIN